MKSDIDTKLQHDVLAELEWEPSIDASKIGVTAKDGVVTLTGSVNRYIDKMTAERVAKRIFGVKGLANDIDVKLVGSLERNDSEIAAAAVNALKWNTSVPVAPPDRLEIIRSLCDRLICLLAPPHFYAVGQFYRSFATVEDEEVVRILREFAPATLPAE